MSREAAEAYAAALEQLPKTKDDYGTAYTLRAMLLDPGDGYPLLLTCYAGDEKMYDEGWPTLADHDLPYQVWTFNGKTAERYPFETEANDIGTDIQFGSIDGKPGIYVRDGMSADVGSPEGCMYYTVSEYQVKLLHHLWHTWSYIYTGSDPEQGQAASLQAYLDDGWVLESTYDDWSYLDRYELDGTVIRGNDPDYARLTEAYTRIQESFQASPDRVYMLGIVGYIPVPWSSPSELCAALRGESVPSAGTQDAPYSNKELERMTAEFFQTNYPNDGKYVVFDDESEDGGSTLDVIVRFQWSESSGVRTANVYVAHIRIDKLSGVLTDLNTYETLGTLW